MALGGPLALSRPPALWYQNFTARPEVFAVRNVLYIAAQASGGTASNDALPTS